MDAPATFSCSVAVDKVSSVAGGPSALTGNAVAVVTTAGADAVTLDDT